MLNLILTMILGLVTILLVGCDGSEEESSSVSSAVGTIIPLYSSPDDGSWDTLVQSSSTLTTIAIVNPNSAPVECNTSIAYEYKLGLAKLQSHSIRAIGYVYTNYANRSIDSIKADIDRYRTCFPNLEGFFLDETNSSSLSAPYYQMLNNYIKETNSSQLTVLNPGVYPEEAVVDTADIVVIYENDGDGYDAINPPEYVSKYPSSRFALLGTDVSVGELSKVKIDILKAARVGYIYLTDDGVDGTNPWDTLSSHYEVLIEMLR